MNDLVIRVEGLSKKYHIGAKQRAYRTLRETLTDAIVSPFSKVAAVLQGRSAEASEEEIWALQDVSFEARRGEVIGIIGRNGAGKSTVLKILSRITEPTKGRVCLKGRVGSLLEVGTGFHPELTGRENIYLNGAILGMRRAEIDRNFDEIVAFSEIERFIDTPVKHYSSGMYVRLAFAVAAHMEPDILIVDEVLAVGDAAFQNKCLGKMENVAEVGRTVLFVSHNMGAVSRLCGRALWLDKGQVKLAGSPAEVIGSYLSSGASSGSTWLNPSVRPTEEGFRLKSLRVLSTDDRSALAIDFNRPFKVEIAYELTNPIKSLSLICRVTDAKGNIIWTSWDTDTTDWMNRVREAGQYVSVCEVPARCLRPGRYLLTTAAYIMNKRFICDHQDVLAFDVSDVGYPLAASRVGMITPLLEWKVKRNGAIPHVEHQEDSQAVDS